MKKKLLICLFAAIAAASASAAEFGDASLTFKQAINVKCEGEECAGTIKGNLSFSANVQLTGPEATALNDQTTISIFISGLRFEALLGSDPNFQNGDTSAKLTAQTSVFGDILVDAKLQLNWANDDLKIKIIMPFAADAPVLNLVKDAKNAKIAKDLNGVEVSISALEGVTTIFQSETFVPGDSKEASSQSTTAEGNESLKTIGSFKTKNIPLPEK